MPPGNALDAIREAEARVATREIGRRKGIDTGPIKFTTKSKPPLG